MLCSILDNDLKSARRFRDEVWGVSAAIFSGITDWGELIEGEIDVFCRLNNPSFRRRASLFTTQPNRQGRRPLRRVMCREEFVSSGTSLQWTNLDAFLSPGAKLLEFGRDIADFLGHPLDSISYFFTPPHSQTLPKHSDCFEVFTLQISGSKTWEFDHPVIDFASGQRLNCSLELRPGDWLYVPAGWSHSVRSRGEQSTSVAIIVAPLQFAHVLLELCNLSFPHTLPAWPVGDQAQNLGSCYIELFEKVKQSFQSLDVEVFRQALAVASARHKRRHRLV